MTKVYFIRHAKPDYSIHDDYARPLTDKEKHIKPEAEIYKRIIEKYKIKPEESIFIDDAQSNIDGASKLNFNTIFFKSSNDLREQLRTYNINL